MPVTAPANGAAAPPKGAPTTATYDDPTENYSDLQRARLDYVPPKPVVLQGGWARGALFFRFPFCVPPGRRERAVCPRPRPPLADRGLYVLEYSLDVGVPESPPPSSPPRAPAAPQMLGRRARVRGWPASRHRTRRKAALGTVLGSRPARTPPIA